MSMRLCWAAAAAMLLTVAACASDSTGPDEPARLWGGAGAELELTASAAKLTLTCAHGVLADRPAVESGEFRTRAVLQPIPGFERRATIRGQYTGRELELTVIYDDLPGASYHYLLFPHTPGDLDGACPR